MSINRLAYNCDLLPAQKFYKQKLKSLLDNSLAQSLRGTIVYGAVRLKGGPGLMQPVMLKPVRNKGYIIKHVVSQVLIFNSLNIQFL